jgi:hypothetical protein
MGTGRETTILESQKRAELSALKSVFKFFSPEALMCFSGSGYDSFDESCLLSSHEKFA